MSAESSQVFKSNNSYVTDAIVKEYNFEIQ